MSLEALNPDGWHRERARLNHDWLIVSFMTFLQAWRCELDRVVRDSQLPNELVSSLNEWKGQRDRLSRLLNDAENALGPIGKAISLRGEAWSNENKEVVSSAHSVWLTASNFRAKLSDLRNDVLMVDKLVDELTCGTRTKAGAGSELYALCLRISQGLSSLPGTEAQS